EQMHLAYEYDATKIWIVNVGDIKPMEFPIDFFFDYAWNPEKLSAENLPEYYRSWAEEQFGSEFATEIGEVLRKYSQYSARRKPELLDVNTYDLRNGEAEMVIHQWKQLEKTADELNGKIGPEYNDAFFQLLLHPIKAFSNLHEMYYAVAKNRSLANHKFDEANVFADKAKQLYLNDSLLTIQYHSIANGKWNHMMDQTHIGYTYWQQPPVNRMPDIIYVPDHEKERYPGEILYDIQVADIPKTAKGHVFYQLGGHVSMDAEHWTTAIHSKSVKWDAIPDIGRTSSGVTSFPVTVSIKPTALNPHLEYEIYTYDTGKANLSLYFSPTLNFHNNEGLKYAISIDDEEPQIVSINKEDNKSKIWESWVANNIIVKTSKHNILKPGKHIVKYWLVSPALVLQKLVLHFGELPTYYLGPPETLRK
ncbi:MAG: glycosyl hydrolase 115 family protein, partial [Flavisolibacter sp.]